MSEDKKAVRKAKSAARKAAREEKKIDRAIQPATNVDMVSPTVASKVQEDIRTKSLESPQLNVPKIDTPAPMDARDYVIPNVPDVTAQAEVQNPSDITNTPKLSAWEEMMANRRKSLQQEKTDAAKMQKYYSLTSALKALGDMGATAIGGAIGGKAIDSAPKVEPYQQSKGYIDAFERAKAANDALRKLDDTEFQLKYADEQKAEERAYKAELDKLDKQWQKDMVDYRAKIEQAVAANNMQLKAKLEAERDAREQEYWKERAGINHKYNMEDKAASRDIVELQMSGKKAGADTNTPIPFTFQNLTKVDIPRNLYPEMFQWAKSLGNVNGEIIDDDNVETILRRHPELVEGFLRLYGIGSEEVSNVAPAANNSNADIEATSNEEITAIPNIAILNDMPASVLKAQDRYNRVAKKQAEKNRKKEEKIEASRAHINSIRNGTSDNSIVTTKDVTTEDYNAKFKRK
jgi:hypothetical protein